VSSFVIGNLSIRHYTESVFPSYVQFLRDYYGFEDEDEVERARMAAIEASNSRRKSILLLFLSCCFDCLTVFHYFCVVALCCSGECKHMV
jgi:hypothetical protein